MRLLYLHVPGEDTVYASRGVEQYVTVKCTYYYKLNINYFIINSLHAIITSRA